MTKAHKPDDDQNPRSFHLYRRRFYLVMGLRICCTAGLTKRSVASGVIWQRLTLFSPCTHRGGVTIEYRCYSACQSNLLSAVFWHAASVRQLRGPIGSQVAGPI